ncbi:MAG: hypothetical protein U0Q22_14080 [Acidimicrobiales bacterium]
MNDHRSGSDPSAEELAAAITPLSGYVSVYPDTTQRWRWTVNAPTHQVLADSATSYGTRLEARQSVRRVLESILTFEHGISRQVVARWLSTLTTPERLAVLTTADHLASSGRGPDDDELDDDGLDDDSDD